MDRFTQTDASSFQPGEVRLAIEFVAGASGAVPTELSDYVRSNGINSMELAATGVYTVHLSDCYVGLIAESMRCQQDGYSASEGQLGYCVVNSVDDPDDPLVTFQLTRPDTGAAIAATEGATVRINLTLQRLQPF